MPTQMNHEGGGKGYKTAAVGSTVNKAQTAHDGGRTTKKAGGKRGPQMNSPVTLSIKEGFCKSPGKAGTGCQGGY